MSNTSQTTLSAAEKRAGSLSAAWRHSRPGYGRFVFQACHYHRNGVAGAGYYAVRAQWHVEGRRHAVVAVVFEADEHIAILGDGDLSVSYRYEDFDRGLRDFVKSPVGQAMAFGAAA